MKSAPDNSVIENVTTQLLGDASTRMRRPKEILLKGLAENPRQLSTQTLPTHEKADDLSEEPDFSLLPIPKKKSNKSGLNATARNSDTLGSSIQKYVSTRPRLVPGKLSSENWIPENIRFRSIHRDIAVAKQNLYDTLVLETGQERNMKSLRVTDLQKAHNEES
jgi:hypothetical protein